MNCNLYVESEHGGNSYYVLVKENIIRGSINGNIVKAIHKILDGCFTIGEYLDLKFIVGKIEDMKLALELPMPPYYGEENGLDREDYFRAYLVLEFLFDFSCKISMTYPLDIFAIKFE